MKNTTKILIVFASFLLLLLTVNGYSQETTTLYGEQVKGTAGKNAVLKCSGIKFTSSVTINDVTGDNAGFWISNKNGVLIINFDTMEEAIGYKLKKGTYYVYPNLRNNQNKATVTVSFQ